MNTKMKVLSLALVGLAGFAGSAMADCPGGPTTAEGGAWTSKVNLPDATSSPLAIVAGGLDGSACKLTAAISDSVAAAASVRYTNASAEPKYRFQFLVDTTALSAFDATDAVTVFQAPAGTAANGFNRILRVNIVAGPSGAKRVRFIAQCGSAATHLCAKTYTTDLINGVNRIEGNLVVGAGAAGSLNVWINAPAGTTEPAASDSIANLDNAAWGGVAAASLGLAAPSQTFANTHHGQVVGFDTFDSRRVTYIGH